MTYDAAKQAIIDLSEKFNDQGLDLVSITLMLAAQGKIYHECGNVVAEADEAIRRGITSLLNTSA